MSTSVSFSTTTSSSTYGGQYWYPTGDPPRYPWYDTTSASLADVARRLGDMERRLRMLELFLVRLLMMNNCEHDDPVPTCIACLISDAIKPLTDDIASWMLGENPIIE